MYGGFAKQSTINEANRIACCLQFSSCFLDMLIGSGDSLGIAVCCAKRPTLSQCLLFSSHGRVIIRLMNYILTDHARKRITKRQIRTQWIEETLSYPARIESDQDDSDLLHALRPIAERGFRVLCVIYNETVSPIAIVTAYFDDEVNDL